MYWIPQELGGTLEKQNNLASIDPAVKVYIIS